MNKAEFSRMLSLNDIKQVFYERLGDRIKKSTQ